MIDESNRSFAAAERIWQSARTAARDLFGDAYERSLRWVEIQDLGDIKAEILDIGESHPVPGGNIPFLLHGRDQQGLVLRLPSPRAAIVRDALYSAHHRIVLLSRHEVLADSINDAYPFRIGVGNVYGVFPEYISGFATSFRARWNNHYHFLIDVLPRLELLRRPFFDRFEEIALLAPGGLLPGEQAFLDRMGLPPRTRVQDVEADALYRVERYVHVSFPTLRFCGAVPTWYRRCIRERLMPSRPSRRSNRILISRRGANKRRIVNYDDLESALKKAGFESIELEKLDLDEQVELFYDAEAVVGAHGAGLTNVLFSDSVKVLELFPSWYVLPHYLYLCTSLGHPYRYCLARSIPNDPIAERRHILADLNRYNDQHFSVNVAKVLSELDELGIR